MDDKIQICVWLDGTWCRHSEVHEYTWKSDDYAMFAIEPEADDEEIECHVCSVVDAMHKIRM